MFVHLAGALPLAAIVFSALTGRLGVNPIQEIEQQLGRAALYFLVASLAVTPVYTVTGWQALLPRRRALGLYSFFYACLHLLTFAGLDYSFNIPQILNLLTQKRYIFVGSLAFLLLLLLAVTSFDYFIRRMPMIWKRLHWIVYPTGVLAIIHFAWARKGTLMQLRGDIIQPFLWGILLFTLLVLRLPPLRKAIFQLRQRILVRRSTHRSRETSKV